VIDRPPPPYEERRERVAVQVFARMHPDRDEPTEIEQAAILRAADDAFASRTRINDLDWQAATLRRLGYEGPTL
jgi:hypothetical protein